jgi:hypothetical protein
MGDIFVANSVRGTSSHLIYKIWGRGHMAGIVSKGSVGMGNGRGEYLTM